MKKNQRNSIFLLIIVLVASCFLYLTIVNTSKHEKKEVGDTLEEQFFKEVIYLEKSTNKNEHELDLSSMNSMMLNEIIFDVKQTVAQDTGLSHADLDILFQKFHQKLKEKTHYDSELIKEKNKMKEYKIHVYGIDLSILLRQLKQEIQKTKEVELKEKTSYLNQLFSSQIDTISVKKDPVTLSLKFKKKNSKWQIDSSPFDVLNIYLGFYAGENNLLALKGMMNDLDFK
ncbi:hypothetical protein BCR24_01535 [Enterococcus ureilyticus]|uniref:DUF5105 domain-containing protein n=1 Tax=Enterococcus ureilyticus TaxID=1131292 RepID=A0A1E5HGN0_9ENTE|nr:hypothetical protein [Enterococcus ureilyticus]MBM7689660.1 hypothetical protein [Enterococcus ureilyticus]OEG24063.1 hypothetical protein BCR24_01535 [Enterococcus ureilyticus]